MKKGGQFALLLVSLWGQILYGNVAQSNYLLDTHYHGDISQKKKNKKCFLNKSCFGGEWNVLRDLFGIAAHLVSWDTYKVFVATFPFYAACRIIDEDFQSHFYDRTRHENINQLPSWCQTFADISTAIPWTVLGSFAFFSSNKRLQATSRVFLVGMPFVLLGKNLIKTFESEECLRPWNEHYDKKKRSYGGFPSGHMAELAYMTVLYGKQFGVRCAIPLGILSVVVAAVFINGNRHYASQLVAGFGWGAMFALASNKVVEKNIERNLMLSLECDKSGRPAFKIAYSF